MHTGNGGVGCELVIGSLTHAQKAQSVLSQAAIFSQVVKVDGAEGRRGCSYGISIPSDRMDDARAVLKRAGIRIRR